MPPTAWALASVWSEVWEAPRFRAAAPSLRRESVLPLLKIAASCVASLLPHVAHADRSSRLPPYGASRELLATALDAGLSKAALPNPTEDPAGFVRALAQACFTTGDGDLAEQLSGGKFEELLNVHCATQLEHAARLVQDPSLALRAALEAASAEVQAVLAAPPAGGDLAAVAHRLLLAQRLERVAEEAQALLSAPSEPEMAAPSEQAADAPSTPVADAAHAADAADENPAQAGECPTIARTRSQVAASLRVQTVKKHVDEAVQPMHDLQRTVSHLAKNELPQDGEVEALSSELQAVEQARKRARNFGEDLLEDMLALDGLQNLAPEDRSTRKAAIAGIEALLEDVDASKSRLGALHQKLQARLEAAKAAQEARARDDGLKAAPAAQPAAGIGGADGRRAKRAAVDVRATQAPPPTGADWQRLRLPLRFHSREEADHYAILATVPGLDTKQLKLDASDDGSTLTVRGLRVPTATEAAAMQRKISAGLQAMADRDPQRLAVSGEDLSHMASQAYLELGQGEYGQFSETFRVPEDADVRHTDASYRDGVLRIVLPRDVMPPHTRLVDSGRGGRYVSGPRGQPPRAPPGGAQGRARAPPLFSGLDGHYYW